MQQLVIEHFERLPWFPSEAFSSLHISYIFDVRFLRLILKRFQAKFRRRRRVEKGDDFRDDRGGLYLAPISRAVLEISI